MRKAPLFALVCLLVAVAGGSYAAKRLLEGKTAPAKRECVPNGAWRGVIGPEPVATLPLREHRIVVGINRFRVENGLKPLQLEDSLTWAARAHSIEMLREHYFAHDGTRESFQQRLARYTPSTCVAENIAWGASEFGTAKGIVQAWEHSPEHRRIMLIAWLRRVGVGVASGRFLGAGGASVATADFAR